MRRARLRYDVLLANLAVVAAAVVGVGGSEAGALTLDGCEIKPGVNCIGADLSNAPLARRDLNGAVLNGANFTGANMASTILFDAFLNGAVLDGARLFNVNLNRAELIGAQAFCLDKKDRESCARFRDARLAGADFTDAKLRGADFEDAVLASERDGGGARSSERSSRALSSSTSLATARRLPPWAGGFFSTSPGSTTPTSTTLS